MTLEDFFTLTEMKDGLTSPARVKQLVDVLQKEKHNIVNNVGEITRQWSTVASTIAATENKDCLDLFLQSDGLGYFDSWLKDAQIFGNETDDSFVEESISALLGAIEKLHMGDQQLDSRIFITVKKLRSHNSCRVQERAKTLYGSWKQNSESNNVVPQDNEKVETVREDQPNASANPVSEHEHLEGLPPGISPPEGNTKGGDDDEKNVDTARNEMMPTMCSETVQPKEVEDQNIQASDVILDHALMQNGAPDPECSSGMLNLVSENHSTLETAAQTQQADVTMGTGGSEVSKQGIVEEPLDVANSSECDLTKQTQQIRISDKLDAMDSSFSVDSTNTLESKVYADVVKDIEEAHPEVFPPGDVKSDVPVGIVVTGDKNSQSPCRDILVSDDTGQIDDCRTDFLRNSYISDHKTGKSENSFTYLSRIEESGESAESNKHDDTDEDLGNDSDVSTLAFNARKPDVIERSDIELDYGGFDPLEVARQVAIEVEREVDCREPSSSSSERISGRGVGRPGSPNSINRKKDRVIQDSSKDVQTGPSISSAVGEDTTIVTTDNLIAEQEACLPDMDASQVPVAAQTSEPNSDKGNCNFDLNDEVLPDEMDHQIIPIATPISVVSASRPAAASELPVAPLQFEGALGWKGSAETSAFRPAPPRKNSEASKPFFASGSNNSLQQRQYFDIDLNVAESEDDKIADLMLGKGVVTSVGPSIGEPSALGPERSSRLELDLNCISDGGDVPSHWIKEVQVVAPRNGHQSPSHSSSSSSMQHSLRNFDLNDQPPPFSDFSDPVNFGKLSQNSCPSGGSRTDETVISIMGARVEVNRKEFFPQSFPVTNGRISNNAVDANSTRTGSVVGLGSTFPFAHSNAYGHHSPSVGSNIPFSSAMYGLGGHIPYMMDSRGSPVVPQIIGSALSALPTGFPQPPFIMNMTGEPSGSNGVVPFQHNFDLNSGVMVDGGRNTGGLRQFFNSGQGRSIDDHMRPNSQSTSSSSGVGGKRKETDGGWEPYPFNYKHHQGPWK